MKIATPILSCFVVALAPLFAHAQTGTLDQQSPYPSGGSTAWFNGDSIGLTWQAQVNSGLTGQLEGFALRLSGVQGATLAVRLRLGPGWNTTPPAFQTIITKPT